MKKKKNGRKNWNKQINNKRENLGHKVFWSFSVSLASRLQNFLVPKFGAESKVFWTSLIQKQLPR